MAPSRRKGASKAAAAAAARRQWKVGDLVLAKVKGFPAWPATVSEPEKWGYSADWKKVLVYFFGTQQIAFCNPADVEPFTEEKKQSLLTKRHGKGSDFVRAVQEIIDSYEKLKNQNQADDFNSEEVVDMSGRNMASSSADLESKEKIEAPEATFDSQFNPSHSNADGSGPSLPVDDTSASALVDDVDKKEEPGDTTIVTETSLHTVYSSRKRTKDLPLQNGDSKEPLVRRSRSSSRLESRRLRDSVVQSSDTGKSSGTVSATVVCDGFLTRNKSKRKSAEASEFDDADLSGLASSGSIEDNGSDVVTVESDSISLNEGSTIDSACKMDHSEAIVGCFSGDLQTKAVVLKKKRKPNRKRPTNDSLEPIPTVDKEVDVPNTSESSQNDFEKTSVSGGCPKKDGDEHLPLVKRARVRMGEPSSLKEPNSNTNTEDNAQKEHMVHTSGETNKSSSCDDHIDRISLMMNAASDASPSQGCTQFYGNKPNHWKTKKDQSFGCSVDGEAALPPSKRLHRALEAMSANAAEEGQSRNDKSSDMNTLAYGCLVASMSRSHMAVEGQMATVENVDSIGSDAQGAEASGFPSSLSPVAGKNTESTPEADFNDQGAESSNSQNNESGKEFFLDAGHCADEKSPCGGSDGGEIISTALLSQSPRHLLSSPDRKESDVRSAQVSEYDLLRTEDKGNTETIELINFRSEKTDKEFDMCEGTAMSMDPVSAPHEDLIEASLAFQSNTDGACFEKSRSSELPLDDSREENDMSEVVTEVVNKQMQKEPSSVCFPNGHVGDGVGIHSSPSVTDGGNSLAQASPHNASSGHVSTSDNSSFIQNNGSCSPDVHLHHKITSNTLLDEEGKSESMVSQRPKSVGKYAELNAALTSFEAMLGSLTRTKESIGRATRVAIECAKLGVSSKVVDILAHCLETESSLHRRVDLFFLVDSILKGDVGGLYPSAIQAMLPRLLAAAAPPGNSAHENRRQCLKVLRLWLERKILSESVIRRHMRELDSLACSAAGAYSRRSLRTQRSFDDPLREMEGMLVDEYGSNSSFQLPGFCMPSMVKDEDGGSDSDGGSLEAVAPGHSPENREDHETTSAMEKHRHILEDVDGELEMEDVAPSCETELNSSSGAIGVGSAQMSQNQFEQHFSVPFAPPLPQDVPPSSPPLPSSPPPLPLAPLPPPIPPPGAVSDPYTNGIDSKHYADSHFYADSHNMHETVAQSNAQQSNTPRINRTMSEAVHYHAPDCRDLQRNMRESYPDPYFHNKGYPLWPPHPPPTNQFSYGRGEPHFKPRREAGPPPPYSNRHHFEQYWDRENFYDNHERMEHGPHEPHDSWRFPPHSFSGPRYPGKGKFYEPDPFVGPPCEETRYSNQGWRFPSRSMNHRNFMPFRPPLDGRIPISNRGPGYWRPR